MIIQRILSSSPLLAGFVRYFFHFEPDTHTVERVTPNGTIQISLQINQDKKIGEQVYVLSRFAKPRFIKPADLGQVVGICFYPWAISSFLKIPAYEITDKKISLEDIFGSRIKNLHEQILNTSTYKEAIRIIESYLINSLKEKRFDEVVMNASRLILKSNGTISLNKLLSDCNISERRLEQRFNEAIGVSPKFYCRVTRFQKALSLLNSGVNLNEITYLCGYFDQSHFIRDFKLFSATTPIKYQSEKHNMDNICATAPPII